MGMMLRRNRAKEPEKVIIPAKKETKTEKKTTKSQKK